MTYIKDIEQSGLVVQDTIKVKSWQALHKTLSKGKVGTCSLTINLYRTNSSALINGNDAKTVANEIHKMILKAEGSDFIQNKNQETKKILQDTKDSHDSQITRKRGRPRNQRHDDKETVQTLLTPPIANTSAHDSHEKHVNKDNKDPQNRDHAGIQPNGDVGQTNTNRNHVKQLMPTIRNCPTMGMPSSIGDIITNDRAPLAIEADRKKGTDICPHCESDASTDVVLCEECMDWIHLTCEQLTEREVKELDMADTKYFCKACQKIGNRADTRGASAPVTTNATVTAVCHATQCTQSSSSTPAATLAAGCHVTQCTQSNSPIPAASVSPTATPPIFTTHAMVPVITSMQPIFIPASTHTSGVINTMPHVLPIHLTTSIQQLPLLQQAPMFTPAFSVPSTRVLQLSPYSQTVAQPTNTPTHSGIADDTQRECNKLKQELKEVRAENELQKKKWAARERQLKTREAAITVREANQSERDEQLVLLKKHFHDKAQEVTDLRRQNDLLKVKLLTSEELREKNVHQPAEMAPPIHTAQANTPQLVDLTTTIMATAMSMMVKSCQQPTPPATKIININQPGKSHYRGPRWHNRREEPYKRVNTHRQERAAPWVHDYNHKSNSFDAYHEYNHPSDITQPKSSTHTVQLDEATHSNLITQCHIDRSEEKDGEQCNKNVATGPPEQEQGTNNRQDRFLAKGQIEVPPDIPKSPGKSQSQH